VRTVEGRRGAGIIDPDESPGGAVGHHVGVNRVEVRGGDDFLQLVHVGRLDVDHIYQSSIATIASLLHGTIQMMLSLHYSIQWHLTEASVAPVQVPPVDAQIVSAQEGLSIHAARQRVDMVCVGVCEHVATIGVEAVGWAATSAVVYRSSPTGRRRGER